LFFPGGPHPGPPTFRETGHTFIYEDVPQEVYDGLLFADSLCAYFNSHVRDRFAYREI
jgi:hypothetical protein